MGFKVLHVIPTLEKRGAQLFACDLIQGIAERDKGIEQHLFVLGKREGSEFVQNWSCDVEQNSSKGLRKIINLKRFLYQNKYEVMIAHGSQALKFAVFARGFKSTPPIVHRKIGLTEMWPGRARWLKIHFQRWLLRQVDTIAVVGQAVKNEAIELLQADPGRIKIIYRGVKPELFKVPSDCKQHIRSRLDINQSSKVLISVGSLSWEKNHQAMLYALAQIRQVFPDTVLLVVGDGPDHQKLKKLATELDIQEATCFLGSRDDIPELMAASDILLLTSLTEGVPGVLIEAAMSALPSVAWNVAGVSEVIVDNQTGRVTPYKDLKMFVSAVLELLSNESLRCQMGENARNYCMKHFTMDQCVEEFLSIFRSVKSDVI